MRSIASVFSVVAAAFLFAPSAQAKTCKVAIESNDQMQFNQSEIAVDAACTQIELTLKHAGKLPATAMGHNWVLAKTADFRSIAIAGGRSTAADAYLPKDDARVLAHTKLIGGGESATVTFATAKLAAGGDYTFFCSFPGHWNIMKGRFVFGKKPA